jgi:phosphoribosyl-AMP cyclohydrolase
MRRFGTSTGVMSEKTLASVRFGDDGLIPVVVQDAATGDVLMLAHMNAEALRQTRQTGRAHYWSRGRGKLWRKGETSGNEQIVETIFVNCEQNSLLVRVHQIGAVCHDGYDTCFYRTLDDDGSLTLVRERVFDPTLVYGAPITARAFERAMADATLRHYGAYEFLRETDLETVSGTSRRLRQSADDIGPRIADELRELAGVLDGTHRHADPKCDLRLEASQVLYWVVLAAVRHSVTWNALRPDRALLTADETLSLRTVARLLVQDAADWEQSAPRPGELAARAHATLALVGQACRSGKVDPLEVVLSDLADLESRDYLKAYFSAKAA